MKKKDELNVAFFYAGSGLEEHSFMMHDYKAYAEVLGCSSIDQLDTVEITINDKTYQAIYNNKILDDFYKHNFTSVPSIVNNESEKITVGNVIICNAYFDSLTRKDIISIKNNIDVFGGSISSSEGGLVLFPVIRAKLRV